MQRVLLILLLILFLFSVGISGWIFCQKQELQDEYETSRREWVKLKSNLTEEIVQAKKKLSEFSGQIEKLKGELNMIKNKMESAQAENSSLLENIKKQKGRIYKLVKKIEEKEELISKLKNEKKYYVEQVELLRNQKLSSREYSGSSSRKLQELNREDRSKNVAVQEAFSTVSAVQLPPIVVRNNTEDRGQKTEDRGQKTEDRRQKTEDRGKILIVNQAENFVIINLGKKNGITKGMSLEVHRGQNNIGRVKVIEVRDNFSAADIEKVKYGEIFIANDRVVLADYF